MIKPENLSRNLPTASTEPSACEKNGSYTPRAAATTGVFQGTPLFNAVVSKTRSILEFSEMCRSVGNWSKSTSFNEVPGKACIIPQNGTLPDQWFITAINQLTFTLSSISHWHSYPDNIALRCHGDDPFSFYGVCKPSVGDIPHPAAVSTQN